MNDERRPVRRRPSTTSDRRRNVARSSDDIRDQLALAVSTLHELRRERDELARELRLAYYDLARADSEVRALAQHLAVERAHRPRLAVAA
mgnify:CR=1 FL=1